VDQLLDGDGGQQRGHDEPAQGRHVVHGIGGQKSPVDRLALLVPVEGLVAHRAVPGIGQSGVPAVSSHLRAFLTV
jgi:hypothetical protein